MAISAQPIGLRVHPDICGRRLILLVAAGAFLTAFDASSVNATLPLIRDAFATTIDRIQWVLNAGLLVTTALLLIFGRLGDLVGHHRIYVTGFGAFLAGCLLCAMAGGLAALIASRVLQGIGAAMLLSMSPALLAKQLPPGRRGLAFGAKASCLYLGLIVGPALGEWVAARFGWRSVFWMQLLLAVAVFVPAACLLPADRPSASKRPFDFAGAVVWACMLVSFLFLLGRNRAESWIGISRATVAAAAFLFLLLLIAVERRSQNAVLDLSCFRHLSFLASVTGLFTGFASSYMLTFAVPFYVVEVLGRNHSNIGPMLALNGLSRAAVAVFSGRWSDRVDPRWFTVPGMLLLAVSLALLSHADENSPIAVLIAAMFTTGVAMGCFVPSNNNTLMGYAPRDRYGAAAGILATSRTLGMTVGVALGGAILSSNASVAQNMHVAFSAAVLLALTAAAVSWLSPRSAVWSAADVDSARILQDPEYPRPATERASP
jgi:EmrB/QacA subfamily drug resistance transporter